MTTSVLDLSVAEREELERRLRLRTGPAEDARRARMILAIDRGDSYTEIAGALVCNRNYISRWKERFLEDRLAGLYSRNLGRAVNDKTPKLEAKILAWTLKRKPRDGSTHWSTRQLAKELSVNHMLVARVWARAGIQPHRLEHYQVSNDPDFETKAADIIGLYLQPPEHAAVFCVDEKTAIQALDRTDPVLPLSPGRAERHGFEYYRHGTLSLRGVEHEYGEGGGQDRVAPHQRRVRGISHPNPRAPTASSRDPRDRRQPLRAQDQTRAAVPGGQPAGAPPLHPHLLLLVESDRALVLPDRTRRDCTRGLYFEARSQPETPTVHPQVQRRRDPDQVGLSQPTPSHSTWYQVTCYRPSHRGMS